jgi:15-cis-phytoene synthase
MSVQLSDWEHSLLALTEAGDGDVFPRRAHDWSGASRDAVHRAAYAHCGALTRLHSRTFHLASGLLPEPKRQAVRALYAFCRTVDDLVDHPRSDSQLQLTRWRGRLQQDRADRADPVDLAWHDARHRHGVPTVYAQQLIDGVTADLTGTRYDTFESLSHYCYGVACTVGLMAMHIIGYQGDEAKPYAIRLGTALQMTNILRDVGEDWRMGRLYLPQRELAEFGLYERDIAAGALGQAAVAAMPAWQAFMRFQIARVRDLYAAAMPGVAMLNSDGRLAIQAAADLYAGILDVIERNGYDVFTRRASLGAAGKLRRMPAIWLRARRGSTE